VTALDRSAAMLAYAHEAAEADGVPLATLRADMTDFRAEREFAAAFNPPSSLRLLPSDAAVDAHLRCMAAALAPGAVYAVDLALQEGDGVAPTTDESWEAARDGVTVRGANEGVLVREGGRELRLAWGAEAHLRAYTEETLRARVAACSAWRIES
jgi:hypothetical protein